MLNRVFPNYLFPELKLFSAVFLFSNFSTDILS